MQPQKTQGLHIEGLPSDIQIPDLQFVPLPPSHQQVPPQQHAATPQQEQSPPAYAVPHATPYSQVQKPVPVATAVQPPSPQQIFRFWDGLQWAYMDPIEIQDGLTFELGGNPDDVIAQMYARRPKLGEDQQPILVPKRDEQGKEIPGEMQPAMELNTHVVIPATRRVVAAVRKVFKIPAVDRTTGQGFNQGVVERAFNDFMAFLSQKKSSTEPAPTSAPPLVPVFSPSPTKPNMDSGSTSGGCGCS